MPIIDRYAAMTKTQLIDLLTDGQTESVPGPIVYRPDGQPERMGSTTKDARGNVIGSQVIEWTYFASKPYAVKDIIVTKADAAAKPIERMSIRHYTTGKQPTWTYEELWTRENDISEV